MSKLSTRIDQMKNLYEELMEHRPQTLNAAPFFKILRYHINLLKEVDELADAINNNDEEGVKKFVRRRCND